MSYNEYHVFLDAEIDDEEAASIWSAVENAGGKIIPADYTEEDRRRAKLQEARFLLTDLLLNYDVTLSTTFTSRIRQWLGADDVRP